MAAPIQDFDRLARLAFRYVARARCRSFSAWNERTRARAARAALAEAATFSGEVVGEVVRTVGGGLWRLPARALGRVLEAFGGLFGRPGPEAG